MNDPLDELIRSLQLTAPLPSQAAGRSAARTRILDAAISLFSTRGYDGVRTREIASAAGVAEKTLFHHFGSKANLFAAALQPVVIKLSGPASLAAMLQVLADPTVTLREKLRALSLNRIAFLQEHPALASFILRELLLREAFRETFFSQVAAHSGPALQSLFTVAVSRGEIAPVDPERALRLFLTTLLGYAITRSIFFPDRPWDDAAEVDAFLDTLFAGWTAR